MCELLPARLGVPEPTLMDVLAGKQRQQPTRSIQDVNQWVQCFNTFISVVALRGPEKVRDLLAYSSIIVRAARDFFDTPWLSYDAHFRRHAAASPGGRLAVAGVDPALWTLYFTNARPKMRCTHCDGIGHSFASCNHRPYARDSYRQQPTGPSGGGFARPGAQSGQRNSPICKRWNYRQCTSPYCSFQHVCLNCKVMAHKLANAREPLSRVLGNIGLLFGRCRPRRPQAHPRLPREPESTAPSTTPLRINRAANFPSPMHPLVISTHVDSGSYVTVSSQEHYPPPPSASLLYHHLHYVAQLPTSCTPPPACSHYLAVHSQWRHHYPHHTMQYP